MQNGNGRAERKWTGRTAYGRAERKANGTVWETGNKGEEMYTFDSRIRYSETDSEGKLSLDALLNYFQDVSTFQSEDLGVGVAPLKERNLVWVLAYWQIVVEEYPMLCDEVTVGTFPYAFRGCMGSRNFFMTDRSGNYYAKADSLWSLLDATTFKLSKVPQDIHGVYGMEEKLDMPYAGRKLSVPEEGIMKEAIEVKLHHLDTNKHVNNGQYVRMAGNFLPEGFVIGQMRAEYRRQARLHDKLYPFVAEYEQEGKEVWVISLRDKEGNPYVNVEFTRM